MKCDTCNGTGEIDDAAIKRIEHGKAMRASRLAAGRSMREQAALLGMSLVDYSAVENGRLPKGANPDAT